MSDEADILAKVDPFHPIDPAALAAFRDAARAVKAAEAAFQAASRTYAEAIKKLSEEVTK